MCFECLARYTLGYEDLPREYYDIMKAYDWPKCEGDINKLSERIADLYDFEKCSVGGPLHILLDDWNVDELDHELFTDEQLRDHWSVIESIPADREKIVKICKEILELMKTMTVKDRAIALGYAHNYLPMEKQ